MPRLRASSPRTHPETQRYWQAGAYATAKFASPRHDPDPIEFYQTQLMLNYSCAVILEGDNPAGYTDLEVFVAPAPLAGETLYVRRQHDVAAAHRAKADAWEELVRRPDGMSMWMEEAIGPPVGDFVRKNPRLAEDARSRMLAGIAQVRSGPPPRPVEHWAVSARFQGIQRAGLVVVNVRDPAKRPAAEQLLVDAEQYVRRQVSSHRQRRVYIDSGAAPTVVCRLKSCRSSEGERRAAQT